MGVATQTWGRVAIICALFAAVFWHNLIRLWLKTNPFTGEANWSHAICVPIIGLYYLYIHREDLIRAHSQQFVWDKILRPGRLYAGIGMVAAAAVVYLLTQDRSGIALSMIRVLGVAAGVLGVLVLMLDWSIATLLFGLATFVYGIEPGRNDYLSDLGMVISMFGIVLLLCGWEVMKIAWFPIAFLVVALPWPGLVYSWVAEPLSMLAAHVAVMVLKGTGVDSTYSGTKIIIMNPNPVLPPRILNVAEACAGMRSLMTFIAVGAAVAFLVARPLWQRLIIVVSAIPIAIFCNVMRISGQGLLDHYVSTEWSESFAHQFVGMVMLLPAFFLILGVAYLLDQLFIEEADDERPAAMIRPPTAIAAPAPAQVRVALRPAASPTLTPTTSAPNASSLHTPSVAANRKPAVPPASAPASPSPAPRAVTPPRPAGIIPPRPITAAKMNPRNASPGIPPRPVNPIPRTPVNSAQPRSPVVHPSVTDPKRNLENPTLSPSSASAKPLEAP